MWWSSVLRHAIHNAPISRVRNYFGKITPPSGHVSMTLMTMLSFLVFVRPAVTPASCALTWSFALRVASNGKPLWAIIPIVRCVFTSFSFLPRYLLEGKRGLGPFLAEVRRYRSFNWQHASAEYLSNEPSIFFEFPFFGSFITPYDYSESVQEPRDPAKVLGLLSAPTIIHRCLFETKFKTDWISNSEKRIYKPNADFLVLWVYFLTTTTTIFNWR